MYKSEDQVSGRFKDIGLTEHMSNKCNGDKANLHVFIDNCNNAFELLNPVYKIAFVSVVNRRKYLFYLTLHKRSV